MPYRPNRITNYEPSKIFDALGNPVRRQIVGMLADDARAVGEIAKVLPISRPAISRHLRVLQSAGLVAHEARGTRNLYHLSPKGFQTASSWLAPFWDDALTRFRLLAENTTPESDV